VPLNEHGAARGFDIGFLAEIDELQRLDQREETIGADRQSCIAKRSCENDEILCEIRHVKRS